MNAVESNNRSSSTHAAVSGNSLSDTAFARAAGASLVAGNSIRLLKDAAENYPAWLDAINHAQDYVLFENYIIYNDKTGNQFADALIAAAQRGVRVRVIYDWFGRVVNSLFSGKFWRRVRESGAEVRVYNPPRFDSPLGWIGRDHRKTLSVDGRVAFVSGLCVGDIWAGKAKSSHEPWRDTGVEIKGLAVADVEAAFADIWATMGDPIPAGDLRARDQMAAAGDYAVRVVWGVPSNAGLFRLDQLVAAVARKRLWLTDPYYAGTTAYVQALRAAARDGVDVRLLVPGKTDNPFVQPLSRAGFRPLLEVGVRVFEWNGEMIHAKTSVSDARWARVGSSNLNIASWLNNYELDVVIEDERFARRMEAMYLADLENSTEIVLDARANISAPGEQKKSPDFKRKFGSGGRAIAGAVRVGSSVGAAVTNRRALGGAESRVLLGIGAILLGFVVLMYFFPRVFLYPFTAFVLWIAVALLFRGFKMRGSRENRENSQQTRAASGDAPQAARSVEAEEN